MKKGILKIVSFVLSTVIMLSFAVVANADIISKENMKSGSVIDVVKYDVNSDTYKYGTMKVESRNALDPKRPYLVLGDSSFKASEGYISNAVKNNVNVVKDACNQVFTDRKGKIDLTRFGNIDSESYSYSNSTIAPYAVPIAAANGVSVSEHIWLAVGDKKGNVNCVYINVTDNEKAEPEVSTEKVSVKVVTPRKMSIRLEDGTVLTNKSSFQIPLDKEIKFQMCSNNWDTDSYDDNGNGIAGTVVYKVVVSSKAKKNSYDANSHTFTLCKADKTLRTDNNSCFMAVRYHFSKGDYNKQTGIKNVVNTPTESLSVNLPLGSTITSDAYVKGEKVTSSNVFVETTSDKSLSVTDFYWNY